MHASRLWTSSSAATVQNQFGMPTREIQNRFNASAVRCGGGMAEDKAQSASTGAFRAFTGTAYGGYCGGYFGCQRNRTSIWII